jgi:thiosulfate/3-mercaptopyruvate sulfurtransferase
MAAGSLGFWGSCSGESPLHCFREIIMPIDISLTRRAFAVVLTAAAIGSAFIGMGREGSLAHASSDTSKWVIEAPQALELIAAGAVVLDTRGADLKKEAPLEGAQAVVWQDFTNADQPVKGRLLDDDKVLTEKIQALGISKDTPVIAVADTVKGWGEDGRIVWTLRTLGHTKAYLVNGGIAALTAAGAPKIAAAKVPGDFVVSRVADFEITKEELAKDIGKADLVILDTREPREYAGETPYGETRGGHVPGAKHIFYKDVVGADGKLLPEDQLKARLAELGVSADTEVVSYCTGGIRSGFVTAVLNNFGYKARNYAGSMWEWSAQPADQYPLVTN